MVEALQRAVPGRFGLTADGSDVVIRCEGTVTSRIARSDMNTDATDRWESDVVYADGRVNVWFGQVTKDDAAFRWRDVLPLVASIPVVAQL